MNSLINAILVRKDVALANDGRLLKKLFFGLLILTLAFQPGEFGNIIRQSMTDAYLQVSVFVGFTLFIFVADKTILLIVQINSGFIQFSIYVGKPYN